MAIFGRIAGLLTSHRRKYLGSYIQMMRFNRFNQRAAQCALLFCLSFNAFADETQDANKLYKQGQNTEALTKVESILAHQPKEASARFLKALILSEQGQTDEAIHILTALSEDYPQLPEPYNNLAVIYANQGQYEKAKTALEKALRTHPSYATAHDNLGDIYAKMASQAYDRALQLDRSSVSSKTKLSLIKELPSTTSKTNTQIASATVTQTKTPTTPTLAAVTLPSIPTIASSTVAVAEVKPSKPVASETSKNNNTDEILEAVNIWAKAWSTRNANKYLSMYAKDFKTPNNMSRSSWESQRRDRIDKPQAIVVTISNAKVSVQDANSAKVSFVQSYRSGTLKATTYKTMEMTKNIGTWQILSERSGGN
jgi:tetratricopeptide (TPR) repeat protein